MSTSVQQSTRTDPKTCFFTYIRQLTATGPPGTAAMGALAAAARTRGAEKNKRSDRDICRFPRGVRGVDGPHRPFVVVPLLRPSTSRILMTNKSPLLLEAKLCRRTRRRLCLL